MQRKTILLTGSSGTIGTRLAERLIERDFDVVGVDIRPNIWNTTVNKKTILVDLRDARATMKKLPKKVDLILHFASHARVYNLIQQPELALENVQTTMNVLEYARQRIIPRIMFASSREVYGTLTKKNSNHGEADLSVEQCENPYAASKIAGEAFMHAYKHCYEIEPVLFRFSNVYGRYDISDRVIPVFIKLMRKNKDITIFGRNKQIDFTYIDDVVDGVIDSIAKYSSISGKSINLATGEGTSLQELARMIKSELGATSKVIVKPNRVGEVVAHVADIRAAQKLLRFTPKTKIDEGIKKTVAWYLANT